MFVDVRDPANPRRILFRYDPETDIVEAKQRGEPARRVSLEKIRQEYRKQQHPAVRS